MWHWELLSPEEKAKYLRALNANADSAMSYRIWVTQKLPNIKNCFYKITVIFRVYMHTRKATDGSW